MCRAYPPATQSCLGLHCVRFARRSQRRSCEGRTFLQAALAKCFSLAGMREGFAQAPIAIAGLVFEVLSRTFFIHDHDKRPFHANGKDAFESTDHEYRGRMDRVIATI